MGAGSLAVAATTWNIPWRRPFQAVHHRSHRGPLPDGHADADHVLAFWLIMVSTARAIFRLAVADDDPLSCRWAPGSMAFKPVVTVGAQDAGK